MPHVSLSVVRCGKQWGVSADGEVMVLAKRKRDATVLAEETAQTLRESGFDTDLEPAAGKAPVERRSFQDED